MQQGSMSASWDVLAVLRRHPWLALGPVVVLAALGAAAGLLWPATYVSSAVVLVDPVVGAPFSPEARGDRVNLETEAQLVNSPAVAAYAADELGGDIAVERLQSGVSASVPASTQLLDIRYSAEESELAQRAAQAFAQGFLDYRGDRAQDYVETREQTISGQRAELEAQLEAALAVVGDPEASAEAQAGARDEAARVTERLAALDADQEVLADLAVVPGQIVTPATAPRRDNTVVPVVLMAAGALLGVLVGLLLAWRRDRRQDSLRSDDLADHGLAVLGVVPPADLSAGAWAQRPSTTAAPADRHLRTHLVAAMPPEHSVLAVVGVGDTAAGQSAGVATRLAAALSLSGVAVGLVDADPATRGVAAAALGAVPTPGLSDVLLHGSPLEQVVQETRGGDLLVVTAGAQAAEASERYMTDVMRSAMAHLRRRCQWLVMPVGSGLTPDGEVLATLADAAVLVVEPGRTRRAQLVPTMDNLERFGVPVLGVVLVEDRPRRSASPEDRAGAVEAAVPAVRQGVQTRG